MHARRSCRCGPIAISIVMGLHGCAVGPLEPEAAPSPVPQSPAPVVQGQSHRSRAPVTALMARAQDEQRAGRLELAAVHVERALRIDPYAAGAWQLLAEIRLQQGAAAQAEVMAMKSNGFAFEDRTLQRRNWSIIAQARRLQGNERGARVADRRAQSLEDIF